MNIAVIFAGGIGQRMRTKTLPKQFLTLHKKPIIIHTLDVFENCSEIDAIVVACVKDWIPYFQNLLQQWGIKKVVSVVSGGETGQISIYNALCEAEKIAQGRESIVLIHDGVRPVVTDELLKNNIKNVQKYGSAITTAKVKETLVIVNDDGWVDNVPNRQCSRVAKAPQSFWLRDILSAHRKALDEGKTNFIDSCTMMYYYGYHLHLIEGAEENIKITTPSDLYVLRALMDGEENAQIYGYENED